jgi:hypothetical protein
MLGVFRHRWNRLGAAPDGLAGISAPRRFFYRKKWPGPILGVQNLEQSEKMSSNWRCYAPAFGGRVAAVAQAFQPVRSHPQDAGATKNFSEQSHMGLWLTHTL